MLGRSSLYGLSCLSGLSGLSGLSDLAGLVWFVWSVWSVWSVWCVSGVFGVSDYHLLRMRISKCLNHILKLANQWCEREQLG